MLYILAYNMNYDSSYTFIFSVSYVGPCASEALGNVLKIRAWF